MTSLKELRAQTPLTATAVASILGVSQPVVSGFESGRHAPRTDTLARYYTAIGRDDLAAPLLPLLTDEQLEKVDVVRQRLDEFVATLPQFFSEWIRGRGSKAP